MRPPARPPVLLVEDDDDVRETLLEALEYEGFSAAGVSDGAAALRWLREGDEKPAVILLDLMMPGMNGYQFREEQVRDPALAGIPVVVLSADATSRQKATSLNAAGLLNKPVKLETLTEMVRRFVPR